MNTSWGHFEFYVETGAVIHSAPSPCARCQNGRNIAQIHYVNHIYGFNIFVQERRQNPVVFHYGLIHLSDVFPLIHTYSVMIGVLAFWTTVFFVWASVLDFQSALEAIMLLHSDVHISNFFSKGYVCLWDNQQVGTNFRKDFCLFIFSWNPRKNAKSKKI